MKHVVVRSCCYYQSIQSITLWCTTTVDFTQFPTAVSSWDQFEIWRRKFPHSTIILWIGYLQFESILFCLNLSCSGFRARGFWRKPSMLSQQLPRRGMATIQLPNVKESRCHQVMATLLQFDCSARKHTGCISLDGQFFYKLTSQCLHWYGTA